MGHLAHRGGEELIIGGAEEQIIGSGHVGSQLLYEAVDEREHRIVELKRFCMFIIPRFLFFRDGLLNIVELVFQGVDFRLYCILDF